MIKLSELQMKEIILIKDGRRLGFIDDLIINTDKGLIEAIVIIERNVKSTFLKKATERIIYWSQIETVGTDTILVNEEGDLVEDKDVNQTEDS